MAKLSDFGDDFSKLSDFLISGNDAVADVLATIEQASPEQLQASIPDLRKRAQRTRHELQTLHADLAKVIEQIKLRVTPAGPAGQAEIHVHVHLHLNTDTGQVVPRIER